MPLTLRFYAKGVEDNTRMLKGMSTKIPIALETSLREFGTEAVKILRRHTPRGATGNLRSSSRFRLTGPADIKRIEILQGFRSGRERGSSPFFIGEETGEGNDFPYEFSLRKGSRPHHPPIEPIAEWVDTAMRGRNQEVFRDALEVMQVAYGVALALSKKGHKKNTYHARALREIANTLGPLIQQIGRRITATPR